MKYLLVLLVGAFAASGNDGMAATGPFGGSPTPKLSPAALPGAVTDLRVVAATDSSLVLSWTEVSTAQTGTAKYVIRYDSASAKFSDWGVEREVTWGGCAAPVYGSTAGGGRTRSCVLSGLTPHRYYEIAVRGFTGTMNSNAVYGPVSNIASGVTAQRVGPMLVLRPRVNPTDTIEIALASLPYDFGPRLYPIHGKFPVGDRVASFYDSTGTLTAFAYCLLVRP